MDKRSKMIYYKNSQLNDNKNVIYQSTEANELLTRKFLKENKIVE